MDVLMWLQRYIPDSTAGDAVVIVFVDATVGVSCVGVLGGTTWLG